jgi:beta-lactamase regulating signal transducer with metallopeptidase domain
MTTLASLLIDTTLKTSAIVVCAFAAAALLRKRSAALRHGVLAAALACAAALPLLQPFAPTWRAPQSLDAVGVLATFSSDAGVPVHAASAARPAIAIAWGLIAPIWIGGFVITAGLLAIGLARLAWLASRSHPVRDGKWHTLVSEIAGRYGIRRPIVLLQSDHPTLLVTWGLGVPKVILPAVAREWTADRARIVLGHELAHIQRRDWLVHIGAACLRSIYWFNPLVWAACASLRRESEHACDDAVLNLGVEGTEYATELIDLARAFSTHGRSWLPGSPAPAMARRSTLERRVRAMLTSDQNRKPISRLALVAIAATLLAVAIPIAGFGAAPQTGPASFSGRLVDTIGLMMPDDAIVLTHTTTKATRETRTDPSGYFNFTGLEPGDYRIDVSKPGFKTGYRVALAPGQALQRDITLQIGSLQETITIVKTAVPMPPRQRSEPAPYVRQPGPCDHPAKGGCIEQPIKLHDKKPVYPENHAESEVKVTLECRIGTDGVPGRIRVVGPTDPDFAKAAADAVAAWRFSPTYLDGVAVEVDMNVVALFRAE